MDACDGDIIENEFYNRIFPVVFEVKTFNGFDSVQKISDIEQHKGST